MSGDDIVVDGISGKDPYPPEIEETTQGHPEEPHDHDELIEGGVTGKDPFPGQ